MGTVPLSLTSSADLPSLKTTRSETTRESQGTKGLSDRVESWEGTNEFFGLSLEFVRVSVCASEVPEQLVQYAIHVRHTRITDGEQDTSIRSGEKKSECCAPSRPGRGQQGS